MVNPPGASEGPNSSNIDIPQTMHLAEEAFSEGNFQKSEKYLKQVLGIEPTNAVALHLLGTIANAVGKLDIAKKLLKAAIQTSPNTTLFHANIAEILRKMGEFEEAKMHCERAISIDAKHVGALGNLALIYFDQKDYSKAKELHNKVLELQPHHLATLNNMGSIARIEGNPEAAEVYYRKAIEANPRAFDPLNNLGELLVRKNEAEEALTLFATLLREHPRNPTGLVNSGLAFMAVGNFEKAKNNFSSAIEIDPKNRPALGGLVMAGLDAKKFTEAETAALRIIENYPESADGYSLMGSVCFAQGLAEKAEQYYQKALSIDKNFISAKSGLGQVYMEQGDLERAEELFKECVFSGQKVEGRTPEGLYSLITVKKVKAGDPEIDLLKKDAEKLNGKITTAQAISLNFALGKMYDDLGEGDKAFPHYQEACKIKRSTIQHSTYNRLSSIEKIKKVFTADLMKEHSGQGHASEVPIFVLGMPRSGTTLTEQIIASHPNVFGAGELRNLSDLANQGAETGQPLFPHGITKLDAIDFQRYGKKYLNEIRLLDETSSKITDKMPANFNYVGLIHLILPKAKIIHVQRNPLDTCLSCYTRQFAVGQSFSYDLEELGMYYGSYLDIMEHWNNVLPSGSIYNIQYEDLVDNTEKEARALLEFCNLDWSDQCLEFYKNKTNIRTASVTQVRQPIYKSSKQRWKKYEKHLSPLIEALGSKINL